MSQHPTESKYVLSPSRNRDCSCDRGRSRAHLRHGRQRFHTRRGESHRRLRQFINQKIDIPNSSKRQPPTSDHSISKHFALRAGERIWVKRRFSRRESSPPKRPAHCVLIYFSSHKKSAGCFCPSCSSGAQDPLLHVSHVRLGAMRLTAVEL